jgi:hypothetical protein
MSRSIQIAVPADTADIVLAQLEGMDGILGLARQRNASIDPPGDIVTVQTTNDALREVVEALAKMDVHGKGTILTSELKSVVSPTHQHQIESESNETIWEEMALLLRQDTNVDSNFLALMFLAGAIAAVGLWVDKIHLVIGAMVIAPAFEPLLRIPFGLISGPRAMATKGLFSSIAGYLMLVIGAGLALLVLRYLDRDAGAVLEARSWVNYWSSFSATSVFVSVLGAAAGGFVVSGLRSVLTTGVMVTLSLIPSMSIVGMAIANADLVLAGKGLARWLVDAGLVILMSALVLGLKQWLIHRRHSLG